MSQAGMEMPEDIIKFNILCNYGGAGAQVRLTSWRSGRTREKESAKSSYH